MQIVNTLSIDLRNQGFPQRIRATQADANTRVVEVSLYDGGVVWPIPDGVAAAVGYRKPDGTAGLYDKLPDGTNALTISENTVTAILAPQVLTASGIVSAVIILTDDSMRQLSTFPFQIYVEKNPAAGLVVSDNYINVVDAIGDLNTLVTDDKSSLVAAINEIARNNGGNADYVGVEPAEEDIPKVFFGAALPQTKDDAIMSFRYISKTMDISGYCKTKAQGNHSMNYPKKNQTVKLYKDAACTEKMKVDFKGWGEQNKFCFKANWVDLSHARNIVSARMWNDVVKSRANYAELPELLRTSPNQGVIDGFPVKVYANSIYQGRYTLNIPKDAWMANMDDELDEHCILCSENYVSGCFRAEAVIDESDWSDEIHDTVPASIVTKWNQIISFVMNSTDEDFVANLGNYFDITSLIDYYLFGLVSCDLDGFGKNQIYMTYDGNKWYASEYDLDATWGNYYNGQSFVSAEYARTQYQDFIDGEGNLLYVRLEKLFADAIKERWKLLKNGALSIENIVNRFERFTDIVPPYLVEEDYAETTADGSFTAIPGQGTNNIQQIRNYAVNRKAYCDKYIALLGTADEGDENVLYALTQETTFDGTNYIDTGVKLFNTAKDFSIVLDCSMPTLEQTDRRVFSCTDTSGTNGLKFTYNGIYQKYVVSPGTNINGCTVVNIPDGTRSKIVITVVAGIVSSVTYRQENGNIVKPEIFPVESYTSHDGTLLLGSGYHYSAVERYWAGTIYDLKVYDRVLTDAEITAYLS